MTTKLDPPWKQAVADFLATDPKPGAVVTRAQLEEWFGLRPLNLGAFPTIDSARRQIYGRELLFLSLRDSFMNTLLREHQIQFADRDAKLDAWRVMAPEDVAPYTLKRATREAGRALRRQRERLTHTNLSSMNTEQLRAHMEATIRNSLKRRALRQADRAPIELPEPPKSLPRRKQS